MSRSPRCSPAPTARAIRSPAHSPDLQAHTHQLDAAGCSGHTRCVAWNQSELSAATVRSLSVNTHTLSNTMCETLAARMGSAAPMQPGWRWAACSRYCLYPADGLSLSPPPAFFYRCTRPRTHKTVAQEHSQSVATPPEGGPCIRGGGADSVAHETLPGSQLAQAHRRGGRFGCGWCVTGDGPRGRRSSGLWCIASACCSGVRLSFARSLLALAEMLGVKVQCS